MTYPENTHPAITPSPLRPGDKIAIFAPATTVKREYVEGAAEMLSREGFSVEIMPSALGPSDGSYAASFDTRLADLRKALADPEVKCILCARGGYGCNRLLPHIPTEEIRQNPKWIIGFSDISALHALWLTAGVKSLHAPMAKHLTILPSDDPSTSALLAILRGERRIDYKIPPTPYNRPGTATGRLQGGNLAVLNGLAATPYDILTAAPGERVILFIEDISEAIYAVERMLVRLYMSGFMHRIAGLIVGQFTEYRPDLNFPSMEAMIDTFLSRCHITGIPVAFNFPTGHVDLNLPLIEGEEVTLKVTELGVTLTSD